MPEVKDTLSRHLARQGVSRRSFLKFCSLTASTLALPAGSAKVIAQALDTTPRPSVVWVSAQECTGCTESTLRSFDPTLESLILNEISLDYTNTLMVPSGAAAEAAREQAIARGGHVLIVDGSIPSRDGGAFSIIGGRSALDVIQESARDAALVIAIGNCASFGGIPKADPNPTGAAGVDDLIRSGDLLYTGDLVNLPGCPPVPEVITAVIVHYLAFGVPPLDPLKRPLVFFGRTVHDTCDRLPAFDAGIFAERFDDPAALERAFRKVGTGPCLLNLGCKGPVTFNACSSLKWNGATSYPMLSGHGCLGCSEPNFWDRPGGFYEPLFRA